MNIDKVPGIKSVTYYVAVGPVECCSRCFTGIRNVFLVNYQDGLREKYGSECINKIMNNAPSLRTMFQKNAKKLAKYQAWLAILSGPVAEMPRGSEYFNSGMYFIADAKGGDIFFNNHWYFHPEFDGEKNASSNRVIADGASFYAKMLKDLQADLPKITAEITRLETFLAKVLRAAAKETKQ